MSRSIVALAFAAMFLNAAAATNFTVGSPSGSWDTATNLNAWSQAQTFSVGDNLLFQYPPSHNVLEVSKSDYDACQASNAILTDSSGMTVVPLTKSGKQYFICGIPGHCSMGMKMEVNVLAASSSIAASPSTLPTLTGPVALSPLGFPVVSPSGSPVGMPSHPTSSAGALKPLVAIAVGAVVAAFVA